MKTLFFILAILISQFAFGQQREIDSLINLLKTDKKDTIKLIHLYGISDLSETIGNYPDGIKYGNKAIEFADVLIKKNKDKIIQRTAKKYKAKANSAISLVYFRQDNYPLALKYCFKALRIYEKIDFKYGVAICNGNIGLIYQYQYDFAKAIKFYYTTLKIFKTLKDKRSIANTYINIANGLSSQGNYPEALKNLYASLKILDSIDDKYSKCVALNSIGRIYCDQGNYPDALLNLNASLKLSKALGDKYLIINTYNTLGIINLKLNNISESKIYLEDGLNISKEIAAKSAIRDFYFSLAKVDSAIGNYKSQIANYKMFIIYRDSLNNEETRKKTIQSQMSYDFEKKEAVANAEHKSELKNQKRIADEKNRKQKLVTYFVIGGLGLVLIFAVFVFRSLRITKKQKILIEMQKIAVEQHQKEIIDSIHYAKRIQTALLPSGKNIEKNINRLKKDK